jgi:hypothetical protein
LECDFPAATVGCTGAVQPAFIRKAAQEIPMLMWLGKLISSKTAVGEGRDNPALHAAVHQAAVLFDELPGKAHIDEAARQQLARQLFLDLHEIFVATSPVAAARQKLAPAMLRWSLFQVLLIPPPPKPDVSGLRGLPGITGELGSHLDAIARKNGELHAALYEHAVTEDDHALEPLLLRAYWQSCWCLKTFESVRKDLGDSLENKDWFRPFLFAVCANQENSYRQDIGLPPALEPHIAASAPVAYSLFTDIVLAGAKDPLAEWTDYHRDSGIPMPEFDGPTTLTY